MKFSGLTSTISALPRGSRRSSWRAVYMPPKPPPTITTRLLTATSRLADPACPSCQARAAARRTQGPGPVRVPALAGAARGEAALPAHQDNRLRSVTPVRTAGRYCAVPKRNITGIAEIGPVGRPDGPAERIAGIAPND